MHQTPDMSLWQGRVDHDSRYPAKRWHQIIAPYQTEHLADRLCLLGFACDAGVRRNHGRPGAAAGPAAIRQRLANLPAIDESPIFDAGDVVCIDDQLDQAQKELAGQIEAIRDAGGRPLVLGGGHEVAWGSFQGLSKTLRQQPGKRLGIINFDAHFDLRDPVDGASSGTPFRQIIEYSHQQQLAVDYLVLGINPASNTTALFNYARDQRVYWVSDLECELQPGHTRHVIDQFLSRIDQLYLSVCLDVFPAGQAPGVSAPAAVGVTPAQVVQYLHHICTNARDRGIDHLLTDIAEMNPAYDRDGITASLAARVIWEITSQLS